MIKPFGYIARESLWRMENGGNESRVTVPIHKNKSNVATIPLYTMEEVKSFLVDSINEMKLL